MAKRSSAPPAITADWRILVLFGHEQYLLAERTRQLADALRAKHGEIQTFILDGTTCTAADLLDELRSFGLLAEHKLVILENADDFLTGEGHRPLMERYAADPVDSATLLMRAGTWRKGRLDKHLEKVGAVIPCKEVGESTATKFCIDRCAKRYDATIEPDAAAALVGFVGPDLSRLDTELAKLASYVGSGGAITPQAVSELVGLGRDEQFWTMKNFVARGKPDEAFRQLRVIFDHARNPRDAVVPVTWAILDVLCRVHAVARLQEQGLPDRAIPSRLNMKWGEPKDEILAAARHLGSRAAAQLLHDAVSLDMRTKTGYGDPVRSVEAMTVLVTDTLSCRASASSGRQR